MKKTFIPLAIFAVMVVVFLIGLFGDPREIPSPFIDKPAPAFKLPRLYQPNEFISNKTLTGQVSVVNVFASWCTSCIQEHPLLVQLSKTHDIHLIGLNYKDNNNDALAWLQKHGNPYELIAVDENGKVGIDWGVYGVPETFVMDQNGIVRFKYTGPLDAESIQTELLPVLKSLNSLKPL